MSQTTITLLFLLFAVVSFILEKIPLGLTATIVALGLNLTNVLTVKETFAGYVNSNVILCVGMFVVGQALFETGMANKIGGIVTKFAKSENLSIIGAPGNLMGVNALEELGLSTSFFMYAPIGIPMLICGIIYFVVIGCRLLPDKKVITEDAPEQTRDFSNVPKWKQAMSLIVLILVILAMIFEDKIGIKIQISACLGAVILVLTGVISEKEALKSIDLKVVLLFGGSLALASALEKTGAGTLIADKIVGIMGSNPSPTVLLLVIFVVTCVLTNFMSNTATTALMVPIAVSLAESLSADPRAVVIATVIAGSCAYATPIGMPANTMVVGLGGYKFKDYVKSGLPLIFVSFVLCMILLPILYPFYP